MFDELKDRLRKHEGVIPHFYLDTVGYVTCGVGHKVPSSTAAADIPMIRPSGLEASDQDRQDEWEKTRALEPGKLPEYYAQRTTLRLTEDAIEAILEEDVQWFYSGMKSRMDGFKEYPEPAQQALLDMAFQLGISGLMNKFPKLVSAAVRNDWLECAAQCHRIGIQDWRNEATQNLFEQAAQGA